MTPSPKHYRQFTDVRHCVMEDQPDAHNVFLIVDNQQFCVTPLALDTKDEAEWMREMLCKALARIVHQAAEQEPAP